MKHVFYVLLSIVLLYSCKKVSEQDRIEIPKENKTGAFRTIPNDFEIKLAVESALQNQGISPSMIVDEANLEDDYSMDIIKLHDFFNDVESDLNIKFPIGQTGSLRTVKQVKDYIKEVLLKEHKSKHQETGTLDFFDFDVTNVSVLPASFSIAYSCDLKYLIKGLDYEITDISEIKSSMSDMRGNKIAQAKANMATAPDRVYDYVVKYQPFPSTTSIEHVNWFGNLSIEILVAYKCQNFDSVYTIEDIKATLEHSYNFDFYDPESPTNGILNAYIYPVVTNRTNPPHTPPGCFVNQGNPGGGNPGGGNPGNNHPPTSASQLQSTIIDHLNQMMIDLGRPVSNITLASTFLGDLGFLYTDMANGPGEFDLDYIDFILFLEWEFDIEIPDATAENFSTVGDVFNYLKVELNATLP